MISHKVVLLLQEFLICSTLKPQYFVNANLFVLPLNAAWSVESWVARIPNAQSLVSSLLISDMTLGAILTQSQLCPEYAARV